jgi:thiamine pyrophosphokinase
MSEKKIKSILIIANGQMANQKLIQNHVRDSDCIIAADGGSNYCYENNIYPKFIIGDLDSISQNVLSFFKAAEIIRISDQDRHDLDKAISFARTLNPEKIIILGAFGKRIDHSLANLVFIQTKSTKIPLIFVDDYGQLTYITGEVELNLPAGKTISLFSFLPVFGISLEGFEFPLANKNFPHGFNGLSNKTTRGKSRISIGRGSLFLYCLHENTAT